MNVAFIGCVDFSYAALDLLLGLDSAKLVGIVTRRESRFNADFRNLGPLAEPSGIPVFYVKDQDQRTMADWLRAQQPDVIYCFGWSYILRPEVLAAAPMGVIGFHPAALPQNRGRHPLIWALALGLEETASSFFFMDEGVDTGDLLSQASIAILPEDDATSLYRKVTETALRQISDFTPALAQNRAERRPQPQGGNVWRKRGRLDGQIDWRMSAQSIHNLTRALTRPYAGAHCIHDGTDVKVWCTRIVACDLRNIEPGKVLRIEDGKIPIIKCGEDSIALVEHNLAKLPAEGNYL